MSSILALLFSFSIEFQYIPARYESEMTVYYKNLIEYGYYYSNNHIIYTGKVHNQYHSLYVKIPLDRYYIKYQIGKDDYEITGGLNWNKWLLEAGYSKIDRFVINLTWRF